jgi:hypothetical protein
MKIADCKVQAYLEANRNDATNSFLDDSHVIDLLHPAEIKTLIILS